MGVCIHIRAERRGLDGRWSSVEPTDGAPLYDGQSPPVFAVLGDVCNDDPLRGEPYRPIAHRRGLPPDASAEVLAWAAGWGADGHSHSWLAARELVDFDWGQIAVRRGVVFAHTFAAWDGASAPGTWCRWVLSSAECNIDNEQMRALVQRAQAERYPLPGPTSPSPSACPPGSSPDLHQQVRERYTTVEWRETYAESCRAFVDSTLPRLLALGPVEELRVVFFFDG